MGKMTAGTRECPTPCKDRETSSTEDGSLTRLSFRGGRIAPGDRGSIARSLNGTYRTPIP